MGWLVPLESSRHSHGNKGERVEGLWVNVEGHGREEVSSVCQREEGRGRTEAPSWHRVINNSGSSLRWRDTLGISLSMWRRRTFIPDSPRLSLQHTAVGKRSADISGKCLHTCIHGDPYTGQEDCDVTIRKALVQVTVTTTNNRSGWGGKRRSMS